MPLPRILELVVDTTVSVSTSSPNFGVGCRHNSFCVLKSSVGWSRVLHVKYSRDI